MLFRGSRFLLKQQPTATAAAAGSVALISSSKSSTLFLLQRSALLNARCLTTTAAGKDDASTPTSSSTTAGSLNTTGTYYPENHPYILKGNYDNMYTQNVTSTLKPELTHIHQHHHNQEGAAASTGVATKGEKKEEEERVDPPSFLLPPLSSSSSPSSSAQAFLQTKANEMQKAVFFYHESNPHMGLLSNTQFLLYDYYALVGPVKHSWFKILLHCTELVELLSQRLTPLSPSPCQSLSIGELAAIIEQLTKQDSLSACKYKATVTENKLQFRRTRLSPKELIVLEVIAQFAGYRDYEIVNW